MALIEMNDHTQFEIPMHWLEPFVEALKTATAEAEAAGAETVHLAEVFRLLPAQARREIKRRHYQVPAIEEML